MAAPYYVYDNHQRNRAKLHCADCPFCNYGRGPTGMTDAERTVDAWLPAATYDEARRTLAATGRREQTDCRMCTPGV